MDIYQFSGKASPVILKYLESSPKAYGIINGFYKRKKTQRLKLFGGVAVGVISFVVGGFTEGTTSYVFYGIAGAGTGAFFHEVFLLSSRPHPEDVFNKALEAYNSDL